MPNPTKRQSILADLSLLLVALVWGGGFVAVKDALATMSPLLLMAYRFALAAVILYIFFHRKIGRMSGVQWRGGAIVGLFLFLAFAFQTFGLQYTTASKQGFLTAVYVVFVPFLYWIFYKKAPPLKSFIASLLAIIGIAYISLDSGLTINVGDVLTLICAVLFAMHILAIEYFSRSIAPLSLAFIQMAVAAFLCILAAIIFEPLRFDLTAREWFAVIYLAVFSTFICFTVQTVAQKYTSSAHASIMMSFESVFAALLGVWLLGEAITGRIIIGSVLVFAAIIITEVKFKRQAMKD